MPDKNKKLIEMILKPETYGLIDNQADIEAGGKILAHYRSRNQKRKDEKKRKHVIYFVAAEEIAIKIGFTYKLEKRLQALKLCSPVPLRLLGRVKGDSYKEKEIHRRFQYLRLHGEWFQYSKDILDYISEIT